uniref:Serine protease n=1 Tax=Seriola lalandi dorsalis TaxID=1841481 RepID=A0A3B4YL09_SERLL
MHRVGSIFIRTRASNLCFAADFLQGEHSHHFTVKFSRHGPKEYTVNCHQPCTVLEAIKSTEKYKEKVKCADANIIIQLGKEDKESIVPTHFPCSCISDDECLIISCKKETIEEAQDQQNKIIYPRDSYIVFFIDTIGGVNAKSKELFRSSVVKQYKTLCVYGEKGMTVEAALKRDGRFIDDLGKFKNDTTVMRQHEKDNSESSEQHARRGLTQTKREVDPIAFDVYPNFYAKGKRGWAALTTELAQLSPKLMKVQSNPHTPLAETPESQKKRMEERLCSDSYEEVSQRKDNFVNFQQSFSEVYRVRNLLKLGESVCEVIVEDVGQGTGFVLFDNFILTNAHLFKGHVDEAKLQVDVDVWIRFNYDEPDPYLLNLNLFSCKKTFIDFDVVQDYEIKVPPGLLRNFGLVPLDGKAYIIGHPAGGVKKMDVTHIIEEEDRVQAVNDHLRPYKDHLFTVHSIIQVITDQGIEHVLSGGVLAEKVVTYKTLMYRGSSGSPVFDAFGRVFGLHIPVLSTLKDNETHRNNHNPITQTLSY